jgi:hypothetical protein
VGPNEHALPPGARLQLRPEDRATFDGNGDWMRAWLQHRSEIEAENGDLDDPSHDARRQVVDKRPAGRRASPRLVPTSAAMWQCSEMKNSRLSLATGINHGDPEK